MRTGVGWITIIDGGGGRYDADERDHEKEIREGAKYSYDRCFEFVKQGFELVKKRSGAKKNSGGKNS